VQLVGAGGDEVGEVAELQLGVAEEGGVGGGGEGAGDGGDEVIGALADGVGQLLGEGFLLGGELGLGHGGLLGDARGGFLAARASCPFVYKDSTNWRDAHTPPASAGFYLDTTHCRLYT
jgi:hypothetical protein